MLSKQITVADISLLTGYSRHKIHGFFKKLEIFSGRSKGERIANDYSPKDLIVLAVCFELESIYGLQRKAIGEIIEALYKELSRPRSLSSEPLLIIDMQKISVRYVEKPAAISAGIVFPLGSILKKVDAYLTFDFNLAHSLPDYGSLQTKNKNKNSNDIAKKRVVKSRALK